MVVVEGELGRGAGKAVFHRAHRQVVPGRIVLDHRPGLPALAEGRRDACGLEHAGGFDHVVPGGRNFEVVGLEQVEVDPHHRGGRVERQRQQVAVRVRIIRDHGGDVIAFVKGDALIFHQLVNRIDGTFGGHHGRGAHFEDLHDLRLFARTERGDRCGHGFRVVALIDRVHLALVLHGVERGRKGIGLFAQLAAHGVPEVDFGLCGRGGGQRKNACGSRKRQEFQLHVFAPSPGSVARACQTEKEATPERCD